MKIFILFTLFVVFKCLKLGYSLKAMRAAPSKSVIILHNGNMRAVYDDVMLPEGVDGPMSRVHAFIEKLRRAEDAKVIYLNSGNAFTEKFFQNALGDHLLAELLNLLNPDAIALGTRAFTDTHQSLMKFIKTTTSPTVCLNVNFTDEYPVHKSITVTYNNLDVVIIGYVAERVNNFPSIFKAIDPIDAIKKMLATLESKVRLVVLLGTSDLETEKKIANEVHGIDIIIGESDNPTAPIEYPIVIDKGEKGKTFIARTQPGTTTLGKFVIDIDENGSPQNLRGELTNISHEEDASKAASELLLKFRSTVLAYDGDVIGKSRVNFSDECSKLECNLGNMVADAFVDYIASKSGSPVWTDAAIAMVNAGSIRTGINIDVTNGEISRSNILKILPFHQYLVTLTLTGDELYEVLEKGMENSDREDTGGFLQVSGLRVICNSSLPDGQKIQFIRARCAKCTVPSYDPVSSTGLYRIVTNEFLARGGDDYTSFTRGLEVVYEPVTDVDVVMAFVQKYKIMTAEMNYRLGPIVFLSDAAALEETLLLFLLLIVFSCFYK